jgi:hypothetical protein
MHSPVVEERADLVALELHVMGPAIALSVVLLTNPAVEGKGVFVALEPHVMAVAPVLCAVRRQANPAAGVLGAFVGWVSAMLQAAVSSVLVVRPV